MRYLIDGCYGDGNVGDEALLTAVCGLLRRFDREAQLRALSDQPHQTAACHGIDCIAQVNPFGPRAYGALVKGQIWPILRAIRWCDCFILGGGELFRDDVGPRATAGMFYRACLAHLLGKRVYALGVGAQEPTTWTGRQILRRAARVLDGALVRDPDSQRILRDLGLPANRIAATADIVFSLEPEDTPAPAPAAPFRLGVALRVPRRGVPAAMTFDSVLRGTLEAIRSVSSRAPVEVLAVALAPADVSITQELARQLQQSGLPARPDVSCDVRSVRASISSLHGILSIPLHGSIIAMAAGVPALGIAYDLKVNKLLAQMDLAHRCLPVEDLWSGSLPHRLCAFVDTARDDQSRLASRVAWLRQEIRRTCATIMGFETAEAPASPSCVAAGGQ